MNGDHYSETMANKILLIFSLFIVCSCTKPSESSSSNYGNSSNMVSSSTLYTSSIQDSSESSTSVDQSLNDDLSSSSTSSKDDSSYKNGGLSIGENTNSQFGEITKPSIV